MYARALKTIRQYHRLSQTKLASQISISKSYINEIENDHKEPSLDILKRYATRFDVPLSSLMLFAERSQASGYDKTRVFVADKILKILEWVAEGGESEDSPKQELHKAHSR